MLNIFRRLVPALVMAVIAFAAIVSYERAHAQAAAAETQANEAGPANVDINKQQIDGYYKEVKQIFRNSAKLLGRANGLAQRKPLIELQNHCSRSLGMIRAILNSYAVKSPTEKAKLPGQAKRPYDKCLIAKAAYNKKPGAMTLK